jgi:hypothetical protein
LGIGVRKADAVAAVARRILLHRTVEQPCLQLAADEYGLTNFTGVLLHPNGDVPEEVPQSID